MKGKGMGEGGTSRVYLRDHRIEADIGVYAEEKGVLQPLIVTIELALDVPRFVEEELGETADYTRLASFAKDLGKDHIDLIETFAERLADRCLALPRVLEARIRIEKPKAVQDAMAGVEIRRRRQG
jgi:7,8-dihydroneopterin aldolase/epimerase/oxygenase